MVIAMDWVSKWQLSVSKCERAEMRRSRSGLCNGSEFRWRGWRPYILIAKWGNKGGREGGREGRSGVMRLWEGNLSERAQRYGYTGNIRGVPMEGKAGVRSQLRIGVETLLGAWKSTGCLDSQTCSHMACSQAPIDSITSILEPLWQTNPLPSIVQRICLPLGQARGCRKTRLSCI